MKKKLNNKNIVKILMIICFIVMMIFIKKLASYADDSVDVNNDKDVIVAFQELNVVSNTFEQATFPVTTTNISTPMSAYVVDTKVITTTIQTKYIHTNYVTTQIKYTNDIMNETEEEDIYIYNNINNEECEIIPETQLYSDIIEVDDYTYISLCNLVAGEYGSDWVSVYDKGAVVACVIHRWWEGCWCGDADNTILNVINAPNQFNTAYCSPYYSSEVTDSVRESVTYALNNINDYEYYIDPWGISHYNIKSFAGDGEYNYFN